jgi:hypothetical protein
MMEVMLLGFSVLIWVMSAVLVIFLLHAIKDLFR